MTEAIFWTVLLALGYAFLGYPLILKLAAFIAPIRFTRDESCQPTVSIVLSVYNEEDVIREKVENFLALEYPPDRLEFVIVSDRCDDRTEDIIRSFAEDRITLLVQDRRCGKTVNLNRGVEAARGEIIVFTDANSMFAPDAVRQLVRHFADSRVGLVSGRSVYLDSRNNNEQLGGAYRAYEEMIKEAESNVTSIVGADGAIYAMRRNLYHPLRSEEINDFIHTIQTVIHGYGAISDQGAVCTEVVEEEYEDELRRQTRIMAQSWLIYLSQAGNLLRAGRLKYFWALTSHKLLRWLTLPLMGMLFSTNLLLLPGEPIYQIMFAGQALFILLALLGLKLKSSVVRVPRMFILLYLASLLGFFKYLSGNMYTTWNPRKS